MNSRILIQIFLFFPLGLLLYGCGTVPIKQYYELNYLPSTVSERKHHSPYPYTVRIREFDIEEAYNRPQIVYRQSPFELRYYVYRVWAVKPSRMITDLIYKHLLTADLVSSVVRRYDEGANPDYELSGMVEALEEYDSDELWFAHVAIRFTLKRTKDGKGVYNRRFDLRRKVMAHDIELVIREMSALIEYSISQAMQDIDVKLAEESGIAAVVDTSTNNSTIIDTTLEKK